jgi:hypothetical protein
LVDAGRVRKALRRRISAGGTHQVYLNIDLREAVPKSGRQRQEIMKFIYGLRDRPRTKGDYTDKDASLQIRQIKIIGDYAVKSVMVVDVRPADR